MTDPCSVRIEQDPRSPRVARLLLNRPERLNAINERMATSVLPSNGRMAMTTFT